MKSHISLIFICLILLLKIEFLSSQTFNTIKCIDVKFSTINYKLSVYNIAYIFCTENGDTVTVNKKCNYQTTGIYYTDRHIEKLFGFQKDSIYSIVLSKKEMDLDNQVNPLSYYSYVKFCKDRHVFNPKTFNPNKKIKKETNVIFSFDCTVDINNAIYSIDIVHPFHAPPDFLLPPKIYPFYIFTPKGDYMINRKVKEGNKYYRIVMNDDSSVTLTPITR